MGKMFALNGSIPYGNEQEPLRLIFKVAFALSSRGVGGEVAGKVFQMSFAYVCQAPNREG